MQRHALLVDTRRVGDALVVSAAGQLESSEPDGLAAALREAAAQADGPVLVDLTGTAFIDSTRLALLLNGLRRLTRRGRPLSVIVPPGPVRRSFELAQLVDTFTLYPTLEAALADV